MTDKGGFLVRGIMSDGKSHNFGLHVTKSTLSK